MIFFQINFSFCQQFFQTFPCTIELGDMLLTTTDLASITLHFFNITPDSINTSAATHTFSSTIIGFEINDML